MMQLTKKDYDRLIKIEKLTKEYYDKAKSNPVAIWSISFSEVCDFLDKLKELLK